MIQMLLERPDFASADISSLKSVIYGASPMPLATIERAMQAWGQHRFLQYYGQTEAPLCIAVLRPEDHTEDRLLSCGQTGHRRRDQACSTARETKCPMENRVKS